MRKSFMAATLAAVLFYPCSAVLASETAHQHPHWSYTGDDSPGNWGKLDAEYTTCGIGHHQSPVNIVQDKVATDSQLPPIEFSYKPSHFSIVDNGHTVMVTPEAGNSITVMGKKYDLIQFHFHHPSEEQFMGRAYEMDAHLVHKSADGQLAVVAVQIDKDDKHALAPLQTIWQYFPQTHDQPVSAGETMLDPAGLLPQDRNYYTYDGSLTTPPCSEGVLWLVLKDKVEATSQQTTVFTDRYPLNARPAQPLGERTIKVSH